MIKNVVIKTMTILPTALLLAAGLFLFTGSPASAVVSATPCPGNICSGSFVVGGQTVDYAYTEHIRPNGTLKIRLDGGAYNTGTLISHIVYGLPAFDTWGQYANTDIGAVVLPSEDINPAQTAYERYDADGCAGCIIDQVLTLDYSGLAAGAYGFDISIFQNGSGGVKSGLTFYVDAGAPSNDNESEAWAAIPDMNFPCADSVDNDLRFDVDCADSNCTGLVGRVADSSICQATETTCDDGFDNDADGTEDCLDSSCDGEVGQAIPLAYCQFENEQGLARCGDGFDNDGDGLTDCLDNISANPTGNPAMTCWKQDGYGCPSTETSCSDGMDNDEDSTYDSAWDASATTGRDCLDYDCLGDVACPSEEHRDASGADADLQCFNSLDDDLDGLFNCADPDCLGMDNGTLICYEKEFNIIERYQQCSNSFDDDGDSDTDCADADCGRQFGNCGPCPDREDIVYDSCADGQDDDLDGLADCEDPDCQSGGPGPDGSLGFLDDAARCSNAENNSDLCSDGYDNDGDGLIDCQDNQCNGSSQCFSNENVAARCADIIDNDGDAYTDCVDSECWGLGFCAAKSWVNSSCQIVPLLGPFTAFTSVDPTVTAAITVANHVNSTDTIRLVGAGTYSSVTIVVGDNTIPADYYPYSQPKTAGVPCTLTGTNSAKMDFTAISGHIVQIFNKAGQTVDGFDLTLSCPTNATPTPLEDFPISISVTKNPGDIPEFGDETFEYVLYEGTPPIVLDTEAEGMSDIAGTRYINLPRGESRRFRAIAQDPGAGLFTSGVCSCTVDVDGTEYPTPDGDCITAPVQFFDDEILPVSAYAEDGVNNIGASGGLRNFNVNVTPVTFDPLIAYPADGAVGSPPFFKTFKHTLALDETIFLTAASDTFNISNTCEILIRNSTGTIMNGPLRTASFAGISLGNQLTCENLTFDLTSVPTWPFADGEYFVTIRATDDDGDSVESNRQVIYICNSVPSVPGDEADVCSWADFDRDGAAEGLFTNIYWGSYQICDNCVNLANPLQSDTNANGVGSKCEPKSCGPPASRTGRCEVNREIVCGYDSDDPVCPGDDGCCPDDAGSPQACACPWGMCLYGGQICLEDNECKFCDNDPTIGCITDDDCAFAGVGGTCDGAGGFGVCTGGAACKRDVDCLAAGDTGPCIGANICDNLTFPWLETTYGNVYSGKKIYAPEEPPDTRYNATYCIMAKSSILNFTSELCNNEADADTDYVRPKLDNSYSTVLGKIDVAGLLAEKYGPVTTVSSADLNTAINARENPFDGEIIAVVDGGDAVVGAHTFQNATLAREGQGTVLIIGGDLYIQGNMTYGPGTVNKLSQLASIGWLVLPDQTDGSKGNVYIGPNVSELVGAFFVGGDEGFDTVAPPAEVSEIPLIVYGLGIARKFHFDRTLRSVDIGAERFIYDGRAVVNPPPGFEDLGKSLPVITDTP